MDFAAFLVLNALPALEIRYLCYRRNANGRPKLIPYGPGSVSIAATHAGFSAPAQSSVPKRTGTSLGLANRYLLFPDSTFGLCTQLRSGPTVPRPQNGDAEYVAATVAGRAFLPDCICACFADVATGGAALRRLRPSAERAVRCAILAWHPTIRCTFTTPIVDTTN